MSREAEVDELVRLCTGQVGRNRDKVMILPSALSSEANYYSGWHVTQLKVVTLPVGGHVT